MKKTGILLIALSSLLLCNCKKIRTCECTNPGGTIEAFKIKSNKEAAEKECQNYYDHNYGNIPMNETSCKIK
ncbi:hypothetical protein [Fluviicola taffensis]|uniref:Uncharacterized protein n=1 Tax=Fluviicola taffensis (strain DSM 16823 / NCIMB 13979 / RW262) TaxID=755732 RepID=F2IEM8_FLUTR|nr:hypothetical protein [Fluviicola taffensis]AEA44567.1 hypothetical protein Fluta_2583 [Fluviicola taffensis DSM 16823]